MQNLKRMVIGVLAEIEGFENVEAVFWQKSERYRLIAIDRKKVTSSNNHMKRDKM